MIKINKKHLSESSNINERSSIFKKNPFEKEAIPKGYFSLHVEHSGEMAKLPAKPPVSPTITNPVQPEQKRSLSGVFKDAGRQIVASVIIFAVGFLLLNWSAYYQIFQSKWNQYFGVEQSTVITETVGVPEVSPALISLDKSEIPDLNLEIAPTDDRIIIPRINQNIPIVRVSSEKLIARDFDALEAEMQTALRDGVVHYPGTAMPGEDGNIVITGHSSYFPWDSGRFKDVFALLHDVVKGDKIVVYYQQDKFVYEVTDIKVVLPNDLEVLKPSSEEQLTLITCTPVGTNLKRLIVIAKPVSTTDEETKVSRD